MCVVVSYQLSPLPQAQTHPTQHVHSIGAFGYAHLVAASSLDGPNQQRGVLPCYLPRLPWIRPCREAQPLSNDHNKVLHKPHAWNWQCAGFGK